MLDRLPSHHGLDSLGYGIQQLMFMSDPPDALSVGTMCSGSDSPLLALKVIQALNSGLKVRHAFSVELNPAKRSFITTLFPDVQHVFSNTDYMKNETALDTKTGMVVPVVRVTLLIGGFSCTDISRLNIYSHQYRQCAATGAGKSGGTLRGMMDYILKHSPNYVILENVEAVNDVASQAPHQTRTEIERVGWVSGSAR
jgi:site-specific DNA-cytosine methylase